MNKMKRSRRSMTRNRMFVDIDKTIIKEIILESYKEIEQQRSIKNIATEFLKLPLSFIFFMLKFVLAVLAVTFLIVPFALIYKEGFHVSHILILVLSLSITVICGLSSLVCHRAGKDVEKETDKYYIVNYFSAIVSFTALIIALIGLYKTF